MKKILIFLITLLPLHAQQYELAVTAIFQNEARWLKEWIEYHRLVGVEHFYLYNNLSSDNYDEVLTPYVKEGIVTLTEWPYDYTSIKGWGAIQMRAYNDAIKKSKTSTQWLAIIDIDEFIVPMKHKRLPPLLKKYKKFGGVIIHWMMFGTSYVKSIPPNKLMMETLIRRCKTPHPLVKSIVQPSRVRVIPNPHFAHYHSPYYQVNTKMKKINGPKNTIWDLDLLRIHHYWSRDEDYLMNFKYPSRKKRRPGTTNLDEVLRKVELHNAVEDTTMFRFVPAVRKRVGL